MPRRPKAKRDQKVIGETEIRKDSWGMLNTTIWRHPSARLLRSWKPTPEEGWIWICPFLARFLKHLLPPAARDSFLGDLVWPRWMFCRFVSKWSVAKWHLDHPQNRSNTERQGNNRGSLPPSRSHGSFAGSEGWQHISVCVVSLLDLGTELHKNLNLPVLGVFLTESFSCKNYMEAVSVATAGLNLCGKDSLEASFI